MTAETSEYAGQTLLLLLFMALFIVLMVIICRTLRVQFQRDYELTETLLPPPEDVEVGAEKCTKPVPISTA